MRIKNVCGAMVKNIMETVGLTLTSSTTFQYTYGMGEENVTNSSNITEWNLTPQNLTIAVFSGIINTITLFGNFLVLYAYCTTPKLRTYTNYFVVSLAISDIIAGGITMPIYSVYWVLGYWPFSNAFCDAYLYINHVFIHISIMAIVVIAYDRWQALAKPFQHLRKRTWKHAMCLISLSYIIPFLVWLPGCLLWPYMHGGRTIPSDNCYPQYVSDSLVFSCFAPIIMFWCPVSLVVLLYWRIIVIIHRTKVKRNRRRNVCMGSLDGISQTSQQKGLFNANDNIQNTNVFSECNGQTFEINQGFSNDEKGISPDVANSRKKPVTAEKIKRAIEKLKRKMFLLLILLL